MSVVVSKLNASNQMLSDLVSYRTYARALLVENRKETFNETVDRVRQMHLDRFPALADHTVKAFDYVANKLVMPSMRALQYGGAAISKNNCRQYNCSFTPVDYTDAFGEILFLLLSGCGVGYSVQRRHIRNLPKVVGPVESIHTIIEDSIEGWGYAMQALVDSYFYGNSRPIFDYSKIRAKGEWLYTTGSKAPGPEPLKKAIEQVESMFKAAIGRQLQDIEVHDILCVISDCVVSGGVRRAAMISLFDRDSSAMLKCKSGTWWEKYPYRARANNSAVMLRDEVTREEFDAIYDACRDSNAGEPGISWSNDPDMGFNPCKPLKSLILTKDGYITFEQALQKKSLTVMTENGWKSATKPFKTGSMRDVIKVHLSNGTYLYGTGNHKHKLLDDSWVRLDNLNIGDKLKHVTTPVYMSADVYNIDRYNSGLIAGWIHGDGWFNKRADHASGYTFGMCFGINELDVVDQFSKLLDVDIKPHKQRPDTCMSFTTHRSAHAKLLLDDGYNLDKTDLTWLYGKDKDYKLGFLRAVFTADGSVRKPTWNHSGSVELYSVRRSALEVISNILREFGIQPSITTHNKAKSYIAKDGKVRNNKACFKLITHGDSFKAIGLLSKFKQDLLDNLKSVPRARKEYATVTKIEYSDSIEDVYDITVHDSNHAFLDTGIVTHNCHEASLNKNFCNLTSVNQTGIISKEDFMSRVYWAAYIGTLQASYTDFPYLSDFWKKNTEQEALLGVSFTGITDVMGMVNPSWLREAAELVLSVNARFASMIGINLAARTTVVKPEGSSSCVLGSSSGIHSRKGRYYLRRLQLNNNDSLLTYLKTVMPELIEPAYGVPDTSVVMIPQESPAGSLIEADETAVDAFNRAMLYNETWVKYGHRSGANPHNVSCTISMKPNEWEPLRDMMWNKRDQYAGISMFPHDNGSYVQAPFEICTREEFERVSRLIKPMDLRIVGLDGNPMSEMAACAGGACEITYL